MCEEYFQVCNFLFSFLNIGIQGVKDLNFDEVQCICFFYYLFFLCPI